MLRTPNNEARTNDTTTRRKDERLRKSEGRRCRPLTVGDPMAIGIFAGWHYILR